MPAADVDGQLDFGFIAGRAMAAWKTPLVPVDEGNVVQQCLFDLESRGTLRTREGPAAGVYNTHVFSQRFLRLQHFPTEGAIKELLGSHGTQALVKCGEHTRSQQNTTTRHAVARRFDQYFCEV